MTPTSTAITGPVSCPYPGLRPFRPDEAVVFFGRDEQVDQLLQRLGRQRFLAVVGTSGCGKSSLVHAGLIPALRTGLLGSAGRGGLSPPCGRATVLSGGSPRPC